jgi:hypothetical protein
MTTIRIGPIQRGVPIPNKSSSAYSEVRKAVLALGVGESREIDGPARSIAHDALIAAKRFGYQITTRKLNGCGIGVWRIK